jgi:DNA-binding GntR family transcriptional regulator
VFDALVELIISRALKPGEHLGEGELAEMLGVSRQPVREAFQQLHSEGWVDLRPGQGAFVHAPTEKEADDLLAVRTLLEAESARRAAARRTDQDVARLWELWDTGKKAVAVQDLEQMVGVNAALHAYVMGIGDNAVLAELSALVDRRVRWHFTPVAAARGTDSWDEHAELIHAIADGDEERAAGIMREHTERTRHVTRTGQEADED